MKKSHLSLLFIVAFGLCAKMAIAGTSGPAGPVFESSDGSVVAVVPNSSSTSDTNSQASHPSENK